MDLRVSPPVGFTGLGHQNHHAEPRTPPGTTPPVPSSRILLDIPCKVCKDHSSGKHYGIFACDGCAGFFKRSIRRNRQYVCKAKEEGKCLVDKTHRNQCRACRLVKCVESGMNKEAVQHERGPRNSTIRRQMSLLLKDGMDLASAAMGHHGSQQSMNRTTSPHHQTIPNHQNGAASLLHHFGVPPLAALHHQFDKNNSSPVFPHQFARMPTLPGPPGFPHQFPHHLGMGGQMPVISSASTVSRNGVPSHFGANSLLAAAMAASVTGSPIFPGSRQMPSPQQPGRASPFSFMSSIPRHYPVMKPENPSSPPPAPRTPPQHQHRTTAVPVSEMSSPVIGAQVPPLGLLTPPSTAPLLRDVEIICESAARLLFLNVQWAKTLPAFTGLPSRDQQLLLGESWRELFILSAAQFLLPFEMAPLMANAGLTADSVVAAANAAAHNNKIAKHDQSIDEESMAASSRASSASPPPSPASSTSDRKRKYSGDDDAPKHPKKVMVARSLAESESEAEDDDSSPKPPTVSEPDVLATLNEIRVLRDVLDQLKQMHVDPTEYACLKAIVLFKTAFSAAGAKDLHTLKEPSTVAGLQDQAQLTLCKYIAAAHPTQPFRFGKLLLMLPTLRTVSSHTISRLFFQKTIGFTPIEKLVCDMYKSSPDF